MTKRPHASLDDHPLITGRTGWSTKLVAAFRPTAPVRHSAGWVYP
jgi:glucuronate isomerase